MNARNDGRGASARLRGRGVRVAVEALEGRALLASGGAITDIATLPATFTAGPMAVAQDGNLWFAEAGNPSGPALGKLSATGARVDVPLPAADAGYTIASVAADAKGNVWYALANAAPPAGAPSGKLGKIAPGGVVTEYALPTAGETPGSVAIGTDGNLYATVSGGPNGPAIAGVNGDGSVTEFAVQGAKAPLTWLTKGPDGNLWFVDGQKLGKITMAGTVTEYSVSTPKGSNLPVDLSNAQLTAGPDGNLWFLGLGGISKITPTGTVTTISSSNAVISSLTTTPDGNVLFALTPPAGSQLASTPGEAVLQLTADGRVVPLPDHVDTGGIVVQMVSGGGAVWLNEGGHSLSRINDAALTSITPAIITPTTPHAVTTDIHKTIAGPIVSFTANYPGALASDFTVTIDYGDGYVGKGSVVNDSNGGFDVIGYNTYKLAAGTSVKVKVDVTGLGGATSEIYGVVNIAKPTAAKGAKAHVTPAHHRVTAKAVHPKGPVTHAVKKK